MNLARAGGRSRSMPGLTPMIDVVFLLLVFFMLAATFESRTEVRLAAGGAAGVGDAPMLVDVAPTDLRLNGRVVDLDALVAGLADISDGPEAVVVLRPRDGADIQRLLDLMAVLTSAGFENLALVE